MTDFIDRLLGRADAPPIRPVVPSLFEPVRPAVGEPPLPMGTFTDSDPGPQGTDVPDPVSAPVPLISPASPAREPAASPPAPVVQAIREPASPATPTEPVVEQPAATPPPQLVRVSREPAASPPAPVVHAIREPVATSAAATSLAGFPPERHVDAVQEIACRVLVPAAQPPAASSTPVVRVPDPLALKGAQAESAPSAHREPPEPARPAPTLPSAHPVGPVVPGYPVVPSIPVAVPPLAQRERREPDVHITIGRVEVKATTEPGRPKHQEQSKQPVLSLDAYLRGRAGGDRR